MAIFSSSVSDILPISLSSKISQPSSKELVLSVTLVTETGTNLGSLDREHNTKGRKSGLLGGGVEHSGWECWQSNPFWVNGDWNTDPIERWLLALLLTLLLLSYGVFDPCQQITNCKKCIIKLGYPKYL